MSLSEALRHDHDHGLGVPEHEARTRWVVVLTFTMMIGELVAGGLTGSLALTADGWHMATHVGALGMGSLAYWFARTRAREEVFSFGTGKVHALAGYTSAIILAGIAGWMLYASALRLARPEAIDFRDAIWVALLGFGVNLVSIKLLHVGGHGHSHGGGHEHEVAHAEKGHDHGHEHDHGHGHSHSHDEGDGHAHHDHEGHGDQNLRASYLHVVADAVTGVLTILALLGGRYLGWERLDPIVGIVGGIIILRWSFTLCRDAARQLLDMVPSKGIADRIRQQLEALPGTEVVDLHVWQIGPGARACLATVISDQDRSPIEYATELKRRERLAHVTVEVHKGEA